MQTKEIILHKLYNNSLEMSFTAEDLYTNHINNNNNQKIILNYKNIQFMSLSFAQEYIYQKEKTNKTIIETNIHKDVKPMLDLVKNRKKD